MKFCIGDFALKFIENNFRYLINALSMEHSNWRFVYNHKTYQALYVNTSVRFIVAGDIKSSRKRCLRVKLYQATSIAEEV